MFQLLNEMQRRLKFLQFIHYKLYLTQLLIIGSMLTLSSLSLRYYLCFFLLFVLFSNGFSQIKPSQDDELNKLLRENNIEEAENLIKEKLEKGSSVAIEMLPYYYIKYSQILMIKGDFEAALSWAKKSELLLLKKQKAIEIGDSYRAISFAFIRLGKLDSALLYAEKLYDFTKENGDLGLSRAALIALGNISMQNKKYENSLKYYLEVLRITEDLGDTINLKVDFYNIGLAYAANKNFDASNEFLTKAAYRAENEKEQRLLATIYGTMSDNFLALNQREQQLLFLNMANDLAIKLGDQRLLAMGYSNMMESHILAGDYPNALLWGKKALETLEITPQIQLEAKIDSMLFVSYKAVGDFKNALSFLEKYENKKNNIRNDLQQKALQELTVKFDLDKKNLLIENQAVELNYEKTKSKLYIFTSIGLVLIICFMVFTYYRNEKNRAIFFNKEKEIDFQIEKNKYLYENDLINGEVKNSNDQKEISESRPKMLFMELIDLIEKQKLYLDPELNQKSLVTLLGTNRQYLYEAIHQNSGENLRALVNRLRINDAKKIIEEAIISNEKINFTEINEKVGFNSYTTYYRAFKGLAGISPNEYSEEFKKNYFKQKQSTKQEMK